MPISLPYKRLNLALILSLLGVIFFAKTKLLFFAPFLIITYYQRPLLNCLWYSLGCGLLIDLFASYQRFGLCALAYTMTTFLLYPQKRAFFSDSFSTLPIMTALFSIISTLILFILYNTFEKSIPITLPWIMTDLLFMPAIDATYALLFTLIPRKV